MHKFWSIGLNDKNIGDFFQGKKKIAERVITKNSNEGIFPILGYSYYEYANSLQEQEPYTALVYIEYALELSDLSMYFPEEREMKTIVSSPEKSSLVFWQSFLQGIGVGIILTITIIKLYLLREEKKINKKKNKEREKKEKTKEILP